jgi:hypothetical protein
MFDLMQYALIFYDVQLILARMGGKPQACAIRMPSWRPQSARALELRAPHNIAQHASAHRAAQGGRVPRGCRKAESRANPAMRGRAWALIRRPPEKGLWHTWEMPGKQSPTSHTTLSRFLAPVMQPLYEN